MPTPSQWQHLRDRQSCPRADFGTVGTLSSERYTVWLALGSRHDGNQWTTIWIVARWYYLWLIIFCVDWNKNLFYLITRRNVIIDNLNDDYGIIIRLTEIKKLECSSLEQLEQCFEWRQSYTTVIGRLFSHTSSKVSITLYLSIYTHKATVCHLSVYLLIKFSDDFDQIVKNYYEHI